MRYENDRPIYLQVIEDISRRLIQGELILGEKLPSVRELAAVSDQSEYSQQSL